MKRSSFCKEPRRHEGAKVVGWGRCSGASDGRFEGGWTWWSEIGGGQSEDRRWGRIGWGEGPQMERAKRGPKPRMDLAERGLRPDGAGRIRSAALGQAERGPGLWMERAKRGPRLKRAMDRAERGLRFDGPSGARSEVRWTAPGKRG